MVWQHWVRRGLLALSLLFAASLVYILITRSEIRSSPKVELLSDVSQATVGMQEFTFLQSRDGVVQWEVRAKHAQVDEAQNQAVLETVHVTLYGKKGREMTLEGDQGTIRTDTRDFVLANQDRPLEIEIEGGYTVLTNHLAWADQRQELHTEAPVTIRGNGVEITGRGLIARLETDEFQIQHEVHLQLER